MKFQRDYKLTIAVSDPPDPSVPELLRRPVETVEVAYPMTLQFDVARSTLSSLNAARLTVLNMKEATRKKVFHDRYDSTVFRPVTLQAGYADQNPLPFVFNGNILSAYSFRRRSDWATEIEAQDGLYAAMNAQIDATIPKGASLRQIIETLIGSMTGQKVAQGAVGSFERESERGVTLVGNSWDILSQIARDQGGVAFVDQGVVHVLGPSDYVEGLDGIPTISSETGLLKAQRKFKGRVDVDLLFEPRLHVGQRVELVSEEKENNGVYRIEGVRHAGTISGAIDQGVVTSVNLWDGLGTLDGVPFGGTVA